MSIIIKNEYGCPPSLLQQIGPRRLLQNLRVVSTVTAPSTDSGEVVNYGILDRGESVTSSSTCRQSRTWPVIHLRLEVDHGSGIVGDGLAVRFRNLLF